MQHSIRILAPAVLAIAAVPTAAHAGACEDGFVKKGNPVTGLRFIASGAVADLPADIAIKQMRGISARRGYDIIASEPESGALLIEQGRTGNSRAFPIEIQAVSEGGVGTVRMEAKLPAGMAAGADGAKTEMCAMLAELKGGKAGRLAAASGGQCGHPAGCSRGAQRAGILAADFQGC